ncbi:hypothetical protein LS70_005850 [Helicobacter sp. MIT 11-5569]|uniref:hypothetical protein n=1 Tax=Helicobacter sp. MIT 11-5569 TaxID=1548151 RepID=UPI00051FB303|nr:hypothetical protein [Helicobacter sp. MIT 11-5569]TLD83268.1 hypothetical protein LS70_005850 [Helicobacter sp. MIT 11-5569]
MKESKWLLFGILTAGVGFLLYNLYKKDSDRNTCIDGFAEGYTNAFSATPSPTAPKKYGEIAKEIQQKQIQAYKQINANHQKQRISLEK